MSNSIEERYPGIEIDRSLWKSTLVNPQDLTSVTKRIANTYLLWNLEGYKTCQFRDNTLWEQFREDFEGWKKETFEKADSKALRLLREHLRTNGVWTAKKQGVSMAGSLAQIVEDEKEHQWTVEEIESQLNEGSFNSKHGQPISSRVLKFDPSTGQRNSGADIIKPDLRAQNSDSGGYFTQFNPPVRGLPSLMKIYTDDKKYSGGNDSLDYHMRIFKDLCDKAGIQMDQYKSAFSIMLKGQAQEYYYQKIANQDFDFETMVAMVKSHFETEERRQQLLSIWHTTTLARICQKNPELSMEMCFETLIKELQKAQLALSSAYQTELCLRDTVINAVRDIPECSMACFKPAATFEALCADIRASISTALRIKQGPSAFPTTTTISPLRTQINQPDDQLYTDHYYGGLRPRHQRNYNSSIPKVKRCFIGGKEDCWSNKHSKDERMKASAAFKERLKKHNKPYDDGRIRQYILELEGDKHEETMDTWDNLLEIMTPGF